MSEEIVRRYVAGFLFRRGRVLLVRKTHPKWQARMMNGIGGEIEDGEESLAAMTREFNEEASLRILDWQFFASEYGPGYEVHFFRYSLRDDSPGYYNSPLTNDKGEDLEWCDPNNVKYPIIGNLHWLLPLAQDPRPVECVVRTTGDIRKLVTW
jgi:8-oxo-dGTP pyrophosphatase MutT (NUDIX family)